MPDDPRRTGLGEGPPPPFQPQAAPLRADTVMSAKGQVVIPKALRDQLGWTSGRKLVVEATPQGVVLKAAKPWPETRMEDVFGCVKYDGPPITIKEMDEAIMEAVAEDWRRFDRR
jgi:AbrB family looped-hinge helix DNA binding protein